MLWLPTDRLMFDLIRRKNDSKQHKIVLKLWEHEWLENHNRVC